MHDRFRTRCFLVIKGIYESFVSCIHSFPWRTCDQKTSLRRRMMQTRPPSRYSCGKRILRRKVSQHSWVLPLYVLYLSFFLYNIVFNKILSSYLFIPFQFCHFIILPFFRTTIFCLVARVSIFTQTFLTLTLLPFILSFSIYHKPSCATMLSAHPYYCHSPNTSFTPRWGKGEWTQLPDSWGHAGCHTTAEKAQATLHREGPGQHGRKCCMALPPYSCWFTSFPNFIVFLHQAWFFCPTWFTLACFLFFLPHTHFTHILYLPGCILCLFF